MSDSKTSLYVVAVAAVIRREGNLLAMRRAQTKDAGPGLWETLSGRVEVGETPLETVKREILEECGLGVALLPRPVTCYPATRLGLPMIIIVYAADYLSGDVTLSDEHDRYLWLSPDAFAEMSTLTPLVQAVHLAFKLCRSYKTCKGDTMIISTTSVLSGREVTEYHGLVSGEAILGANIFRDFFAGIRDIVGGRSGAYERALREAKEIAVREMEDEAKRLGANAVIGVDLDYENITTGNSGGMLMVSASGTAVTIR